MFYDLVLLRHQNQGRFAMAWVASTRGIQTVIREFGLNKIREIDIYILCGETMEYLRSTSNNPKERVSLRMAVHLIQGTIILFNKKVSLFQGKKKVLRKVSEEQMKVLLIGIFPTPPTPVIKEKAKKKRDSVAPMEEFLMGTTELEAAEILPRAAEGPSQVEARKESLDILQAQPLQVIIPEDMFGEFDVISAPIMPQMVPPKPPSETSEKSQLERIEERLIAEQIAEHAELIKHKEAEPKKSSTSSSVDKGPKTIQVEVMVHRDAEEVEPQKEKSKKRVTYHEDSSSNSVQEGHKGATMVVEATVHRSAEGEQETIQTAVQPSEVLVVPEPMEIVEDIQPVKEAATIAETAKQAEIDKEIQDVLDKEVMPKKRPALKQLQKDEIPTLEVRTPRRSLRGEKEKKEKDDLDIITHKDVFPIEIFEETEILYGALADFIMSISAEIESVDEITIEQMRKEPSSRSISTDALRRSSKVPSTMTPVELPSRSLSHRLTQPLVVPASGDFMSEFNNEMIGSTPYRGDIVEMPPKKLYEETRVEYEYPVLETIDRNKEKLVESEPIILDQIEREPELPRRSPTDRLTPTKKEEEEVRKNIIKDRLKLWDETQGNLLVDDLIPEPKNRRNAAKTFFLLLRLVKERSVILIPEENSLEVKYVKKGTLLLQ